MKDLVKRFSEVCICDLDASSGMLSKENESQFREKYKRVMGFDKGCGCVKVSMPGLLEVYVRQQLNKKFTLGKFCWN